MGLIGENKTIRFIAIMPTKKFQILIENEFINKFTAYI